MYTSAPYRLFTDSKFSLLSLRGAQPPVGDVIMDWLEPRQKPTSLDWFLPRQKPEVVLAPEEQEVALAPEVRKFVLASSQEPELFLAPQEPQLVLKRVPDSIDGFAYEDFEITGYEAQPHISAPIAV